MVKKLVFGGTLVAAGFFALSFGATVFAATTGSAVFSVDVDDTVLELTIPASPAVIDLNPTITGASFGTTSINVKVATNNSTGYTLTMTPTNSQTATSLIRTELIGNEQTYREIETLALTDPVSTGYPEADFTVNKWGYRILSTGNYYGVDPNNTTVSHSAWTGNEPTNGINHNLTLAAKVDADTVSGAYETTLVFTATTNAVVAKDTVSFNGNGADNPAAMDNYSLIVESGQSVALPENLYTKSGYSFAGWSTIPSGSGGLVYNDQVSYRNNSSYNRNIILYAQWTPVGTPTPSGGERGAGDGGGVGTGTTLQQAYEIAYTAMHKGMYEEIDTEENAGKFQYIDSWNGANYQGEGRDVRFLIQDMTPEICASATDIGSTALVLDIRDQTSYRIVKAADGRCWAQDDLALDPTLPEVQANMSPATTNATQDAINNYITTKSIVSRAGWSTNAVAYGNGSYEQPYIKADQKDYIVTSYYYNQRDSLADLVESEKWKMGVYYNYCAASLGTYCYADKQGIDKSHTAIDAEYDVCPAGWRLPTGGPIGVVGTSTEGGGEFQILKNAYGNNDASYALVRTILRLPLTGYLAVNGYYTDYKGYYLRIWSSTYYNESSMDILGGSYSAPLSAQSSSQRHMGFPVRCIAKTGTEPASSN